MKYLLLSCFLSLFLLFSSCEHEMTEPDKKIQISGFSRVDNLGQAITPPDPDDWCYDSAWTQDETKLLLYDGMTEFKKPASSYDTNHIVIRPVYPNPVKSFCNFSFERSKSARLKIALVNAYMEKLYCNEIQLNGSGTFQMQLDLSKLKKGELYRFYYVLLNSESELYYRGHGDILKD